MRKSLIIISLFLVALMISGCTGPVLNFADGSDSGDKKSTSTKSSSTATFSGDKPEFDLYVMSQCPYGVQVEDEIIPVMQKFGDDVDFNINFISDVQGDWFRSLHGDPETKGNIIQLCAHKHHEDKYLDFITCMNKDARSIPGNWESCAKELSLDVDTMKTCYEGEEGKELLRSSIKLTKAAGATGSPTMFLNGNKYQGGRTQLDFMRAMCGAFNGDHPECENMPACAADTDCTAESDKIGMCENPGEKEAKCVYKEPVKTQLTILNAKECSTCDTSAIELQLQQLFKGMESTTIDVSTNEGKELADKLGISVVPAFFFDMDVKNTATFSQNPQLASAFEEKAGGMLVKNAAIGSSYFIDEEKRAAHYNEIGVVKGDNRPQIDFYTMSYCPFGNQAEEAIEGAYQVLKDKADFNPMWVIYSNYRGGGPEYCIDDDSQYCSMHGVVELNQNIREDCVKQIHGTDRFFKFVMAMNKECDYKNADTCWVDVAKANGVDVEQVKGCFDTKALDIAKNSKTMGDKLGVQGSPSVFIDGDEYNGPRTAEGYLAAMCAAFDEKPSECDGVPEPAQVQAAPAAAANMGGGCGV